MNEPNVNNLLPRLQRWYLSQCDGEWEHGFGVKIGTLDNPGWSFEVDLESTNLAGRVFTPIKRGLDVLESDDNWFTCHVEDEKFRGYGGPEKLAELIAIFLQWAESA